MLYPFSSGGGRRSERDTLEEYRKKRHFGRTPEPALPVKKKTPKKKTPARPRFVIQKHKATRLHYDFRLEAGGVLKSWAVPKGPSLDPRKKRLAARTEDHPVEYAGFEGIIPEGEYGAGSVIIWDKGTYENLTTHKRKEVPIGEGIEKGHISFRLEGTRLKGAFALTRIRKDEWGKEDWILVKIREDEETPDTEPVEAYPESVKSGKTVEEIAAGKRQRIWHGKKGGLAPKEKGLAPPEVSEEALREARAKLRKNPQPKWVAPMLATLMNENNIPKWGWLFEPKLDGERCLARKSGGEVVLYSRNRKDLNGNYPELVEALRAQAADNFIADGEIVAFGEKGLPSFSKLQPRMQIRDPVAARRTGVEVFFYLFDLVYFDGYDLTRLELEYRKEMLRQVVSFSDKVRFLEHEAEGGREYFKKMCGRGYEGIMAKRAGSRYIEGRTRGEGRTKEWQKFKCMNEQEFIICGYTEPGGSRTGFGSLLLGYYEGGKLVYAGKVGTGYDEFTLKTLLSEMKKLERKTPPYNDYATNKLIPRAEVHWLRPELVCEVAFSEWTPDGLLRHPSFKGLRRDKKPAEVRRERPA